MFSWSISKLQIKTRNIHVDLSLRRWDEQSFTKSVFSVWNDPSRTSALCQCSVHTGTTHFFGQQVVGILSVLQASYPTTHSRSKKCSKEPWLSVFVNKSISNFWGNKTRREKHVNQFAAQSRIKFVKPQNRETVVNHKFIFSIYCEVNRVQ